MLLTLLAPGMKPNRAEHGCGWSAAGTLAVEVDTCGWSLGCSELIADGRIWKSEGFTRRLGAAEIASGAAFAVGVLVPLASAGLILIMLGAIQRKIFTWHTGFWGEKNSGWHYDLLFVAMNLVLISFRGGNLVLW